MSQTEYNENFPCSRGELWNIVTAIYDSDWRKDIEYVSIEKPISLADKEMFEEKQRMKKEMGITSIR